jgi:hypothetical protein
VGINLVAALHTFLTGLFLFGFLRTLRLTPLAGLTSALIWMFCGVQMVWLEFQTPTAALCWLPGLLWAWERFASRDRIAPVLLGGSAGVALALLAGHLHFAFYVLLAFVLYATARTIFPAIVGRNVPGLRRGLLVLTGSLALGIAISACTLLPVVEMAGQNFRSGKTDYASSIGLRLPPTHLLTLVQPNLFGSPRHYLIVDEQGRRIDGWPYWGAFDYIEYAFYIGIPGLLLAILGMWLAVRPIRALDRLQTPETPRFAARFFAGLALLGLLLALGTPICALFFYGVPGYSQFNATARALCLFCFGAAVLSGVGVETVRGALTEQKSAALRFGTSLAAITVCGLVAFPGMSLAHHNLVETHWLAYESANLRHFVVFVALSAAVGWVLFGRRQSERTTRWAMRALPLLAVTDLLVIYGNFNPQTEPWMLGYSTATTDFLQKAAPGRVVSLATPGLGIKSFIVPNYNAVVGLREVQGADSLHTKRFHQLMEQVVLTMEPQRGAAFIDPNTIHVPGISHALFDLLNVRYVTTMPDRPSPDASRLEKSLEAELTIWENKKAVGAAWMVGSVEEVEGLTDFLTRLSDPGFDIRTTAVVEKGAPALDPRASRSPVELTEFLPHRLRLRVDAKGDGLLILSEVAYPGWRAKVDGRETRVLTANHILRSVPIGKGAHEVEVEYSPASYRVGLYFTCAALGAIPALILPLRRRRRKPI